MLVHQFDEYFIEIIGLGILHEAVGQYADGIMLSVQKCCELLIEAMSLQKGDQGSFFCLNMFTQMLFPEIQDFQLNVVSVFARHEMPQQPATDLALIGEVA